MEQGEELLLRRVCVGLLLLALPSLVFAEETATCSIRSSFIF